MLRILLGGAPISPQALSNILRLAGVELSLLGSAQRRISARQLAAICTELEHTAGDPCLGLHLGESRDRLPSGHVLFSAMRNSPTLGQALERYCRFHDIMADFVQPQLSTRGEATVLGLLCRSRTPLHPQHVECIFALLVSSLSALSAPRFEGEVCLVHPRPADISEHLRILGPAVRFAQPQNELVFERTYLERPLAATDEELLGILDQYATRLLQRARAAETWSDKVAELVVRALSDGQPRLQKVARLLATSPRSLQAKLEQDGTSFQAIVDNVRRQVATAHLEADDLSALEIAFLLGYSDQSAFNHAFHRWTGESPLQFRERRRRSA